MCLYDGCYLSVTRLCVLGCQSSFLMGSVLVAVSLLNQNCKCDIFVFQPMSSSIRELYVCGQFVVLLMLFLLYERICMMKAFNKLMSNNVIVGHFLLYKVGSFCCKISIYISSCVMSEVLMSW